MAALGDGVAVGVGRIDPSPRIVEVVERAALGAVAAAVEPVSEREVGEFPRLVGKIDFSVQIPLPRMTAVAQNRAQSGRRGQRIDLPAVAVVVRIGTSGGESQRRLFQKADRIAYPAVGPEAARAGVGIEARARNLPVDGLRGGVAAERIVVIEPQAHGRMEQMPLVSEKRVVVQRCRKVFRKSLRKRFAQSKSVGFGGKIVGQRGADAARAAPAEPGRGCDPGRIVSAVLVREVDRGLLGRGDPRLHRTLVPVAFVLGVGG